MSESERDGKLLLVVAVASIPLWFVLSGGYAERVGFLESFLRYMTVINIQWDCEFSYGAWDCRKIVVKTKYLVAVSLVASAYAYLVMQGLAPNLIAKIRAALNRRKAAGPN